MNRLYAGVCCTITAVKAVYVITHSMVSLFGTAILYGVDFALLCWQLATVKILPDTSMLVNESLFHIQARRKQLPWARRLGMAPALAGWNS